MLFFMFCEPISATQHEVVHYQETINHWLWIGSRMAETPSDSNDWLLAKEGDARALGVPAPPPDAAPQKAPAEANHM